MHFPIRQLSAVTVFLAGSVFTGYADSFVDVATANGTSSRVLWDGTGVMDGLKGSASVPVASVPVTEIADFSVLATPDTFGMGGTETFSRPTDVEGVLFSAPSSDGVEAGSTETGIAILPEPISFMLTGTGMLVLYAGRRKRRSAAEIRFGGTSQESSCECRVKELSFMYL